MSEAIDQEQIKQELKEQMKQAVGHFKNTLGRLRTGQAHLSQLDSVKVNYYGTPTPLTQVATVSCPDARSFLIAPWEVKSLEDISAAIVKSDLGMTPLNDGKVIRLRLPEMTEERRKETVKQLKKMMEEARVAVRRVRQNTNQIFKMAQKDKKIGEDESKRAQEEVQKITDEFMTQIDSLGQAKEKDILTI